MTDTKHSHPVAFGRREPGCPLELAMGAPARQGWGAAKRAASRRVFAPLGLWAVYAITGDEIAQCIKVDVEGNVGYRYGWPGYVGSCATLDGAVELIKRLERGESI